MNDISKIKAFCLNIVDIADGYYIGLSDQAKKFILAESEQERELAFAILSNEDREYLSNLAYRLTEKDDSLGCSLLEAVHKSGHLKDKEYWRVNKFVNNVLVAMETA